MSLHFELFLVFICLIKDVSVKWGMGWNFVWYVIWTRYWCFNSNLDITHLW